MIKTCLLLAPVVLACFAVSPIAQAVVPAPDGGYPNFTTAEGKNALKNLTNGVGNSGLGWYSLFANTTGNYNTGIGAGTLALNNGNENTATGTAALLLNTTGFQNTANGALALLNNTEGSFNTAIGDAALYVNTTGTSNTATGSSALQGNTNGGFNTATGASALLHNDTGSYNTATGTAALAANTTGTGNTATGFQALFVNNASGNTADGYQALSNNTAGYANAAVGDRALTANIDGAQNTAVGSTALFSNIGGAANTGVGYGTLFVNTSGGGNTAVGFNALFATTGGNNTALGYLAGSSATTGSNNVYIGGGIEGVAGESNACYIASIFGQTSASGLPVYINSNNRLGTATSSKRFKEDIKPMERASQALFALKPVTFRYKKEIDQTGLAQFGLVAEEVEKVNANLVVHDKEGKPYSVRYDQVNAMLLNEFLKEHNKVEKLEDTVTNLVATMKAQAAQIQKVSAELESTKRTQQVALNSARP